MTEQEIKERIWGVALKLEKVAGHLAMIESINKETFKDMKELGIDEEYGGAFSDCDSEFDYESLSCEISNNEDEIFENMVTK